MRSHAVVKRRLEETKADADRLRQRIAAGLDDKTTLAATVELMRLQDELETLRWVLGMV